MRQFIVHTIITICLVLTGGTSAPKTAVAMTAVFTSHDVGFAEGGEPGDVVARLPAMNAYTAPRTPIIRLDVDWWYVQDCAGCALRFDRLDPVVTAAAASGMRVLLILDYSPPWANGHPGQGTWFPTSDSAWAAIVDAVVAHFGSQVQAYEVWNEPNQQMFGNYGDGSSTARKARYWQLVKIAYQRVHAGCPGCVVLAGASATGTPVTPSAERNTNESAAWLKWGYTHGYQPYFDAVTHHPYPAWNSGFGPARPECSIRWWNMFGPNDPACGELAAVRAVMVRYGDTTKRIWATEWGYPTAGNAGLSAAAVRDYAVQGVSMWRALDYTGPLFLYSYRDQAAVSGQSCAGQPTNPECHFGVSDMYGAPKEPIFSDLAAKLANT